MARKKTPSSSSSATDSYFSTSLQSSKCLHNDMTEAIVVFARVVTGHCQRVSMNDVKCADCVKVLNYVTATPSTDATEERVCRNMKNPLSSACTNWMVRQTRKHFINYWHSKVVVFGCPPIMAVNSTDSSGPHRCWVSAEKWTKKEFARGSFQSVCVFPRLTNYLQAINQDSLLFFLIKSFNSLLFLLSPLSTRLSATKKCRQK